MVLAAPTSAVLVNDVLQGNMGRAQHRAAFVEEGKAGGNRADADGTVLPSEP